MLHAKHSIEIETNERIRRALHSKTRAAGDIYESGDMVYYKQERKERWLGPATVVFQDCKLVFMRHGGIFVRVSPNRLRRIHETIGGDENGTVKTRDENGDDTDKEKIRK